MTKELSSEPASGQGDAQPQGSFPKENNRERNFRIAVWIMVLVLLLFSPAAFMVLGWFTDAYRDTAAASEVSHRLHEIMFGILFSLALAGAITQLLSPKRNLAGLIQLTVTLATLAIVVTATVGWQVGLLLYLIPLAAVLFYASPIRPFRSGPTWSWVVALLIIASFPFRVEVLGLVDRATSGAQNHTTHWSAMAAFVLVLIVLGVVVALRVSGYRLAAMSVAGAAGAYGIASLAFPYDASSHNFAYAVGLLIWSAAWLVGLRFFDRPPREQPRPLAMRVVGWIVLAPVVLLVSMIWLTTDSQPNVPHRPDPDRPQLMASEVDRATCLNCHATATAGAPTPPHSLDRSCEGEMCWGGRTDCAGCHRIDPALGGPVELIEVNALVSLAVRQPDDREVIPLADDDLARIDTMASPG